MSQSQEFGCDFYHFKIKKYYYQLQTNQLLYFKILLAVINNCLLCSKNHYFKQHVLGSMRNYEQKRHQQISFKSRIHKSSKPLKFKNQNAWNQFFNCFKLFSNFNRNKPYFDLKHPQFIEHFKSTEISKKKYYFLWQKQIFFKNHKMSISRNDILNNSAQNGVISKREQKKLELVLRQIQANENPDSKSHKRRKHTHDKKSDPQARKLIKTESQISDPKNNEASSSARELSEDDSKVQQRVIKRQLKDLHNVYNKNYGIPQQSIGFSEYLVNYTYGQKSKYAQKQFDDWNTLQSLGGKKLQTKQCNKDETITRQINQKLSAQRQNVQQLFSKSSKQFIKRVLQKINEKK